MSADPDDPRKPESPTDLTKPSLLVLRKPAREFTTDAVLQIAGELGPPSAVDTLRGPIQQLVESAAKLRRSRGKE